MQSDPPEQQQATTTAAPPLDPFLEALRGRLAGLRAPEGLRARIALLVAIELGQVN
jgi:hypothetical protein